MLNVCVYCGDPLPDDRKLVDESGEPVVNIEHVFLDALGGTLVIPVHRKCNAEVNKLVDEPFVKTKLMEFFRCRFNIEGSRGRGAPSFEYELPTEGWGPKIVVRYSPNGEREVSTRDQYEKHADGVLGAFGSVSTDAAASRAEAIRRGEKCVAAVQAGAAARCDEAERLGPVVRTYAVSVPEQPPPLHENVEILLRQLAKIALGVCAWHFGDGWISGEAALRLREYVQGASTRSDIFGDSPKATAYAMPSVKETTSFPQGLASSRSYAVSPGEHAFGFFSRESGTWCVVEMFRFVGAAFRVLPTMSSQAQDMAWALGHNDSKPRPI